jgi:ankyrin repeat protein
MITLRKIPVNKLLKAARALNWDTVKELIENKIPVNINETMTEGLEKGKSALFYAAQDGRWDIVQLMLNAYPELDYDARAAPDLNFVPTDDEFRREIIINEEESIKHQTDNKNPLWYAIAANQWLS